MTAFSIPPYEYVSVGPYWVTAEFSDLTRAIVTQSHLALALGSWLGFGKDTCIRRTITDARGVLIFGWLVEPAWGLPIVGTAEMFELMRQCGGEPIGLLDFELEMMARQVP